MHLPQNIVLIAHFKRFQTISNDFFLTLELVNNSQYTLLHITWGLTRKMYSRAQLNRSCTPPYQTLWLPRSNHKVLHTSNVLQSLLQRWSATYIVESATQIQGRYLSCARCHSHTLNSMDSRQQRHALTHGIQPIPLKPNLANEWTDIGSMTAWWHEHRPWHRHWPLTQRQ